jgi:hypothetical protein
MNKQRRGIAFTRDIDGAAMREAPGTANVSQRQDGPRETVVTCDSEVS